MLVDTERSGDRRRTNPHRVAARAGMYEAVRCAFVDAGIPWNDCYREDRGDGLLMLVPADVPKELLVEVVPTALVGSLQLHNALHAKEAQLRLRMAVHAGEVIFDDHGVAGTSIVVAIRLLDATPLKVALAESSGVLALIASEWFYDEVVRHSPASNPASYRRINAVVKETDTTAWICLPDRPYPPRDPDTESVRNGHDRTATTIAPRAARFFAVVEALESVPCLRSEDTRVLVLDQLRPAISGSVRHHPQRRAQMISLLRTCLDYNDGINELLNAITNVEQDGSVPLRRLVNLLRDNDL